ncbi:MAG: T9SS type A sorting domain-containing protein [Bacteroidales bacterium]
MKKIYFGVLVFLLIVCGITSGVKRGSAQPAPTDTLMWNDFYDLPGGAYVYSYPFSNGSGYFFGTNYLDLDQDPNTPYQNGVPSFAQGFKVDSGSYKIIEVLFLVGIKEKNSAYGTPLIASIQLLNDSSNYTINTATGPQSYTVGAPGTTLSSFSVAWEDIEESSVMGWEFTSAVLPSPVEVSSNFAVVVDLFDFYMNGDEIGFMVSGNGGASNIYGKEFCLWLYPDPLIWLQVTHLFSNVDRAIAIFPVVDDGTSGIRGDKFESGIKLGYLYPNPAADKASVLFATEQKQDLEIMVLDQNGKTVKQKSLQNVAPGEHQFDLDVSNYSSGNYYLILSNGTSSLARKMQIIH